MNANFRSLRDFGSFLSFHERAAHACILDNGFEGVFPGCHFVSNKNFLVSSILSFSTFPFPSQYSNN